MRDELNQLDPNLYNWDEMQFILGALFTPEGREIIRIAKIRIWEQENPPNIQGGFRGS